MLVLFHVIVTAVYCSGYCDDHTFKNKDIQVLVIQLVSGKLKIYTRVSLGQRIGL